MTQGVKISELGLVSSLLGDEPFPLVQSGVTSAATPDLLAQFITTNVIGGVTDITVDTNITTGENLQTFTNAGAPGAITLTLPTPAVGLAYGFVIATAHTMNVVGPVSLGEITGTTISSASPYSAMVLKAIDGSTWVATSLVGTWGAA